MKKNITLLAIMLLIPAVLIAQGIVKVKKTSTAPKQGMVTFSHQVHQNKGITRCQTCHHTGITAKSCGDSGCHRDNQNKGYNAIHSKCIGCHQKVGGKAPTLCTQCHKR